jgi:hypothetical protein
MGEVYRARDTKLGRDALKVLPTEFALDAERLARFKRGAVPRWPPERNSDRIVGLVNPTQLDSPSPGQGEIQVVLNWFEELKRRVPVK